MRFVYDLQTGNILAKWERGPDFVVAEKPTQNGFFLHQRKFLTNAVTWKLHLKDLCLLVENCKVFTS